MKLLHQIGERYGWKVGGSIPPDGGNRNFNTLEEILACDEPLSFDGVYVSVYEHYRALKGKDIIFFVSGKYLGGDNSFDLHSGQPLSRFCTLEQVIEMAEFLDAKIGYHGWAHLKCSELIDDALFSEISLPRWWPNSRSLAWPYGDFDERCKRIAHFIGYVDAYSSLQGDGTQYAKNRTLLNWTVPPR